MDTKQFPSSTSRPGPTGPDGFINSVVRGFSAYARWLDSISWKRFFLVSVFAMIVAGILSELPPFSMRWGDDKVFYEPARGGKSHKAPKAPKAPTVPTPPAAPSASEPHKTTSRFEINGKEFEVSIDDKGVRIGPITVDSDGVRIRSEAPAASGAASSSDTDGSTHAIAPGIEIKVPRNANDEEVRAAIEEASASIREAIDDAKQAVADAQLAAEDAREAAEESRPREVRVQAFRPGDELPGFAFLLIVISAIIKIMAAGRFKAEARAVVATEIAESEALKRQVVEARMAAMQAQVEPHFLFNTLASIDHLIETDPPRASKMQKNLIALLRASMPTMREANAQSSRDLGRELAVIRPYLEILKVRMEERLIIDIRVSEGLLSAEFPPMMLQSLVENAIKHGLEPKPEGGVLSVVAEIVHGKLAVTVADTGVGFGGADTAGTGIGLANIRERLQLLHGKRAALVVAENPGGGTAVTITVPYLSHSHDHTEGAPA